MWSASGTPVSASVSRIAGASRPISITARHQRATGATSGAKSCPAVAARDQHDLLRQPVERGNRRADVRALAVVDVVHVIDRRDHFDAMRFAAVLAQRVQQRRGRQVDRACERECGQRVRRVVQPADAQRVGRHQALLRDVGRMRGIALAPTGRRRGFIRGVAIDRFDQPRDTVIARQAVVAVLHRFVQAERDRARRVGRAGCRDELHHRRIVAVQHARGRRAEDPALCLHVRVEAAVPVEVVLRDVEDRGRIGRERARGLELEARQFEHPHVGQRGFVDRTGEPVEHRGLILPATATFFPERWHSRPVRLVVVVLPLVPVIASTFGW